MGEIENRVAKALGIKPDSWMVKAAIDAVNSNKHPEPEYVKLKPYVFGEDILPFTCVPKNVTTIHLRIDDEQSPQNRDNE